MQINPRVTAAFAILVAAAAGTVAAHYEGYKARAYHDVAHVVTACRGHTGADVRLGRVYSPAQCNKWFQEDLKNAYVIVAKCIHVPLNNFQAAALTDAVYNIGPRVVCNSRLGVMANKGDPPKVWCKQLLLWVYADGKRLKGLERRRQDEYQMCIKD